MEKKLTRVGNSYGLIIDRALCRLVGIGLKTPLRVTVYDRRIVIEALALPPGPPPGEENLFGERYYGMVMQLIDRHGMSQGEFSQLHPTKLRMIQYALRSANAEPDAGEMVCRRRIKACVVAILAGQGLAKAIAAALREVPREAVAA